MNKGVVVFDELTQQRTLYSMNSLNETVLPPLLARGAGGINKALSYHDILQVPYNPSSMGTLPNHKGAKF